LLRESFPALAGWANICRAYGATRGESKSERGKPRHYKGNGRREDAALKGRRYKRRIEGRTGLRLRLGKTSPAPTV